MTHNIAPALLDRAMPIKDLHPHPKNARRRNARAKAVLRESLQLNGQYKTVVARRIKAGRGTKVQLLVGHGTVEQASELGWDQVAVDVHDGISDARAAAIVAVDNRSSDLAEYDNEMLDELLSLIPELEGTGYSEADVAEIRAINAANSGPPALTDPDAVPAPPAKPTSTTGDVWLLGPHRLAVGDATDPTVVAAALGGKSANMLLTDPPYNVDYVGKTKDALTIAGDHQDVDAFEKFLLDLFGTALEHVKRGGPAYVFHADTLSEAFRRTFVDAGWDLKQVLVWVKDLMVLGRQDHHWQHEPILYGWRPGAAHAWYGGRTLTTLLDTQADPQSMSKQELVDMLTALLAESTAIRATRPKRSTEHPTMKPVALLVELLNRSSRPGGLILDVCAGSGSTLIACHQTTRVAGLVEKEPKYADVICRRYQQHTGTIPILEQTGDPVDFGSA